MVRGERLGARLSLAVLALALGGCPLLVGLDGDFREVNATDDASKPPASDDAMTAPSRPAAGVTAGERHSCVWFEDGTAACWGNNGGGRLGDGTVESRPRPVDVQGLAGNVRAMAAGAVHTCAIVGGGQVQCWGTNDQGQLGDGTKTSSVRPVTVKGVSGATAIAAGGTHACALVGGGGLRCWGSRSGDQAANGTPDAGGLSGIACGDAFVCASGGRTVTCIGSGPGIGEGKFELQTGGPTEQEPNAPETFAAPRALGAGGAHGCVAFDGRPFCWGAGARGQLGDGEYADRDRLTEVVVGSPDASVTAFAGGAAHTCVLRTPGSLYCFGANDAGQLGPAAVTFATDGKSGPTGGWGGPLPPRSDEAPVVVAGVAAGGDHTCALLVDRSVRCWGANEDGQLGDGSRSSRGAAVRVAF